MANGLLGGGAFAPPLGPGGNQFGPFVRADQLPGMPQRPPLTHLRPEIPQRPLALQPDPAPQSQFGPGRTYLDWLYTRHGTPPVINDVAPPFEPGTTPPAPDTPGTVVPDTPGQPSANQEYLDAVSAGLGGGTGGPFSEDQYTIYARAMRSKFGNATVPTAEEFARLSPAHRAALQAGGFPYGA